MLDNVRDFGVVDDPPHPDDVELSRLRHVTEHAIRKLLDRDVLDGPEREIAAAGLGALHDRMLRIERMVTRCT